MFKKSLSLCVFVFLLMSSLSAQWNTEIIDTSPTSAQPSDIAYDNNGYPHIVYFSGYDLEYTYWTGSGWTPAVTIFHDYPQDACKIVVDTNNNVYLLYSMNDDIYYQKIGTEKIKIADKRSSSLDFVIDENSNIYVVYSTDTGIYYYDGTNSTQIDQSGGYNADVSIAIDINNNPHIVYSTGFGLRYASYSGQWIINTLDSSGDMGLYCSIEIDDNDVIHVSYYDNDNGDLKYAKLEQ